MITITEGQSPKINLLTRKALEAQDRIVELQLAGRSCTQAQVKYFQALDNLGTAITDAVGQPYTKRIKYMEKKYRRMFYESA